MEDTSTGKKVTLSAQLSGGLQVVFSPDDERVIIYTGAGENNGAELFDREGRKLGDIPSVEMRSLVQDLNGIGPVAFSSDSQRIFVTPYKRASAQSANTMAGSAIDQFAFIMDKNGKSPKLLHIDPSIDIVTNPIRYASW